MGPSWQTVGRGLGDFVDDDSGVAPTGGLPLNFTSDDLALSQTFLGAAFVNYFALTV